MGMRPSQRDVQAVADLFSNAGAGVTLERMRGRLDKLTCEDFPALACLLDLLAEHPGVAGDNTLAGAVAAIQEFNFRLWDAIEVLARQEM